MMLGWLGGFFFGRGGVFFFLQIMPKVLLSPFGYIEFTAKTSSATLWNFRFSFFFKFSVQFISDLIGVGCSH